MMRKQNLLSKDGPTTMVRRSKDRHPTPDIRRMDGPNRKTVRKRARILSRDKSVCSKGADTGIPLAREAVFSLR